MKKDKELEVFTKLAEAANFYLNESFHYINESMTSEYAGILFAKRLDKINPSDIDREIASKNNLPSDSIELLQSEIPDVLTEKTMNSLSSAWYESQSLSHEGNYNFGLDHQINSIEILGHLNNFGFFIETLINRHLLFLKQKGELDDLSYSRFSIAKVMERLIFIFKKDLKRNKIHLNEIVNLFSLRNKTVHYTPDNAIALKPKISELISIWRQSVKLIKHFEKAERFNEQRISDALNNQIDNFNRKWT